MNKVNRFEITARDPHKAKVFYESVFGWSIAEDDHFLEISEAGMDGHILAWPHADHPTYVSMYIDVEDVQAALDKATEQGGQVIVPPQPFPQGMIGMFLDLDGNPIGLIHYNK